MCGAPSGRALSAQCLVRSVELKALGISEDQVLTTPSTSAALNSHWLSGRLVVWFLTHAFLSPFWFLTLCSKCPCPITWPFHLSTYRCLLTLPITGASYGCLLDTTGVSLYDLALVPSETRTHGESIVSSHRAWTKGNLPVDFSGFWIRP